MALILIMGLPGAGKSTLRHRLSSAHPELIESTSFDDFRRLQMRSIENNSAGQSRPTENARENRKAFECHVDSRIVSKNRRRRIYLIEDVFYMKSMRRPFLKIAKRRRLKFGIVFLECTSSEAIRRNSRRTPDERQTEETILRMAENLEIPEVSKEKSIILEQEEAWGIEMETILESLRIRIEDSEVLEEDSKELEEKKIPPPTSTSSALQNLDVATRRLVSELIQNDRSLDGRKLSEARKMIINSRIFDTDFDCGYDLKQKLIELYEKL